MEWDLCAFFLGPKFHSREKRDKNKKVEQREQIMTVDCLHFTLDFSNVEEREKFETELLLVWTNREQQHSDARRTLVIARAEAQSRVNELHSPSSTSPMNTTTSNMFASGQADYFMPELPAIRRVPSISSSIFSESRRTSKRDY
jgi:hypothetical protein